MKTDATNRGFTLLELIVVIAILGILGAISVQAYKKIKKQAGKAGCIANLKILHQGFDSHLIDRGFWPQVPQSSYEGDTESDMHKMWILSLEPYGVAASSWKCPSDKNLNDHKDVFEKDEYYSSYMVTPFNPHRLTPHRWTQPWLMERGNYHGQGGHILMNDGSVNTTPIR